ncbi:glycoside hydrolase family 127 protein [Glaciibacter superstes]|uniref:glycoside hydrolase family 127 protein n=1 Tax=Glaciibacter superstes TaxID=501023 RepID=UPI0003B76684|nr:beta-L-arabinofuranosidase domain-containing protein [Glaciibacter superstes]
MNDSEVNISGVVATTLPAVTTGSGRVRPLPSSDVIIADGVLAGWQQRNRAATVPHTIRQLRESGNLDNLRTIAESGDAAFRGRYPFLDTDVFKTLEGLAYELARPSADEASREFFEESVALIEAAQADDGYLNSYFQHPGIVKQPWEDLSWGHELYNLGHLIQAAVAASRQLGDNRLLDVAVRFADLAVAKFGPGGEEEVPGHPEVEMALVELYRTTSEARYLQLAKLFIDRRGHGTVALSVFPAEYFQDNAPLRELDSVTGHAVRMVYLAAGATDVAIEAGDAELLASVIRLWDDMVETKLYVTGGLGSRHSDEAIGDRYELPSERSYSETCAAIGTMQWAWRLFIATGDAHYLDVFEIVLFNAYAAGLSADGCAFFYDNPLQRRPDHQQRTGAEPDGELLRRAWFVCPCCPPNIIRWNAELQDYFAASDADALYLAQYGDASVTHDGLELGIRTSYPLDGEITIHVEASPGDERTIALRVPAWCHGASVTVNGTPAADASENGWLRLTRSFSAGDLIVLTLPMPVRAHGSHPHLDATRGTLSIARGPVVYSAEQQDNEYDLDDLVVDPAWVKAAELSSAQLSGDAPETVIISVPAAVDTPGRALYPELAESVSAPKPGEPTTTVTLVPYYLWGNREALAMRVWLRRP